MIGTPDQNRRAALARANGDNRDIGSWVYDCRVGQTALSCRQLREYRLVQGIHGSKILGYLVFL